MAGHPYKIQKYPAGKANGPTIPPSKYETEPSTLKNFPSSIVNGVTAEGGLFSLTFKSISCTTFVEKLELIKRTLVKDEFEPPIITEETYDAKAVLEQLKNEIREEKDIAISKDTKEISDLHEELQNAVESNKPLAEIGHKIQQNYASSHPDKILTFSNEAYSIPNDVPRVHVDKFEDVQNPDYTPYQPAPIEGPVEVEQPAAEQQTVEQPELDQPTMPSEPNTHLEALAQVPVRAFSPPLSEPIPGQETIPGQPLPSQAEPIPVQAETYTAQAEPIPVQAETYTAQAEQIPVQAETYTAQVQPVPAQTETYTGQVQPVPGQGLTHEQFVASPIPGQDLKHHQPMPQIPGQELNHQQMPPIQGLEFNHNQPLPQISGQLNHDVPMVPIPEVGMTYEQYPEINVPLNPDQFNPNPSHPPPGDHF